MATKSINSYLSQLVETATRSFRDASVATVSKNINLTKNSTLIVLSLRNNDVGRIPEAPLFGSR